ncbi:unnamed protein product [Leuciscus chuanchicus]
MVPFDLPFGLPETLYYQFYSWWYPPWFPGLSAQAKQHKLDGISPPLFNAPSGHLPRCTMGASYPSPRGAASTPLQIDQDHALPSQAHSHHGWSETGERFKPSKDPAIQGTSKQSSTSLHQSQGPPAPPHHTGSTLPH